MTRDECLGLVVILATFAWALFDATIGVLVLILGVALYGLVVRQLNLRRIRRMNAEATRRARAEIDDIGDVPFLGGPQS